MKAMVLRAPRDLRAAEVERPTLGRDQVLVRVTHNGVCGTDLKIFKGAIPVRYPLIMGHEMIGKVVEGGDESLHSGDRVIVDPVNYCGMCVNCRAGQTYLCPEGLLQGRDADGGFADYIAAPRSHVFALPGAIEGQVAPLIQVLTTCLHAHRLIKRFPGQSVVVMGLGVAGQLHVQIAKAWGASPVIGITRSAWKGSLAEKLGADFTSPGGPEGAERVSKITSGRGADLIIDTTGMAPVIADAISMARAGATLLMFGITTATHADLPFYQLYFKELNLVSSRSAKSEDYPASIDLVARGIVNLAPLVTHLVSLTELELAIGMLESDADQRLKIILENPP